MAYTNAENQARFKARMNAAGYYQTIVWIKRGKRQRRTDLRSFTAKITKLTAGWEAERLSRLFNLFITITEGKKEGARKKHKA